MRITEKRMIEMASARLSSARSRVSKAAGPVSSGIEIDRPSDNPSRWAAGRRSRVRREISDLRGNVIAASQARLVESDRVFSTVGQALSRARQLAVMAANDTLDASDRKATAGEVSALLDEALLAANSRGMDGEYLLAGTRGDQAPFDASGNYVGDSNQRTVEAGEGNRLVVTMTGEHFTAARGVDIFSELQTFRAALEANDVATIRDSIGTLETGIHQVSMARAEVGGLEKSLDSAERTREEFELVLAEVHQRAVEVDPIAAASELSLGAQALEAAQALTARLSEIVRV